MHDVRGAVDHAEHGIRPTRTWSKLDTTNTQTTPAPRSKTCLKVRCTKTCTKKKQSTHTRVCPQPPANSHAAFAHHTATITTLKGLTVYGAHLGLNKRATLCVHTRSCRSAPSQKKVTTSVAVRSLERIVAENSARSQHSVTHSCVV
jgi:hypothetical protein